MTRSYYAAEKLRKQGKLNEAIAEYNRAIEVNPNFCWYHHKLGEVFAKLGRWDEAINSLSKAIALNPASAWSYYELGLALVETGKLDEAITAYYRAVEINPNYSGFYNNLGLALVRTGKLSEAITFYQKAIEIEPEISEYYMNLALALVGEEQIDRAVANYRQAIKLNPNLRSETGQKVEAILQERGKLAAEISSILIKENFSQYKKTVTSQFGEDGIIEATFKKLGINKGWCVEFGAADAKRLSNTWNLWHNLGWNAVLIEGDRNNYKQLLKSTASFKNVTSLNSLVFYEGENTLDNILAKTEISLDFELLSIDIDGDDFYVWESVKKYKPKVVIIEHNPTFPPHVEFVDIPRKAGKVGFGSSAKALAQLGIKKGYQLIACTISNSIFLEKPLFDKLKIQVGSLEELFPIDELRYVVFSYKGQPFLIPGNVAYGSFKRMEAIANQAKVLERIPSQSQQVVVMPVNLFNNLINKEENPK